MVEVSLRALLLTGPGEFGVTFKAVLETAGCRVETLSSPDEFRAVDSADFDLVFLDLDLADADGMAIVERLAGHRRSAQQQVFLLKGEGEPVHVIQRGLDLGASGYLLKHRLPRDLTPRALRDLFRSAGTGPGGTPNRRGTAGRPDGCPYSAALRYESCGAFLPINSGAHVACSHLRIGTADTWRLYPRCAIGDGAARAKYMRDQTV